MLIVLIKCIDLGFEVGLAAYVSYLETESETKI